MADAISHLVAINAIQPVPVEQRGQGFYSQLFLVHKSSGGWCPILDLKSLNRYVIYRRFKMHTLSSILDSVHPGIFFLPLI